MCKFDDLRHDMVEAERNLNACHQFEVNQNCFIYRQAHADYQLARKRLEDFVQNVNSIEDFES